MQGTILDSVLKMPIPATISSNLKNFEAQGYNCTVCIVLDILSHFLALKRVALQTLPSPF